ncbi:MAG: hypothetical protein AB1486_31345, partial [Planctomycetota bacterium]
MAVNPLDPLNIVGCAIDRRTGLDQTGHYASVDGGKTWVDGVFPFFPFSIWHVDPAVTFDPQGNVYIIFPRRQGSCRLGRRAAGPLPGHRPGRARSFLLPVGQDAP